MFFIRLTKVVKGREHVQYWIVSNAITTPTSQSLGHPSLDKEGRKNKTREE